MSETPFLSIAAYEREIEPHRRALRALELEWDFFVRDVSELNLFSTSSRIKQYSRAIAKSEQIGVQVSDLDDLAGMRIVVGTLAEVPIVERFFTRQEASKDLRVLKNQKVARRSGYRATHVLVERRGSYSTSVFPGRVEVQIHTIFQHAFNFLSREWSYKQPWQVSVEWNEKFTELSRLLSSLDNIAHELHVQQAQLQETVGTGSLSPQSLQLIVRAEFGDDIEISAAVDACRMYVDLGCKTNAEFRKHLQDPSIEELYAHLQQRVTSSGKRGPISGMTRFTFWSVFGTRIGQQGIKEFIYALPVDI